ncbi:diacylglycerol/lipid kinase family protein [Bacillus solitudinis]|uniref:diacylglycerol/lipid kinase family protein n=1 Tax=Bacillus solitudinis TaxID=2014074 RepID=UPI000C237787|nr:diacylglycerol kinase family protein [Bacillus solitudinis]
MYAFVVNPHSGNGRSLNVWKEVEMILLKRDIMYRVLMTQNKEDLEQFITKLKASKKPIKAVVALGGDGTIHEVINYLKGTSFPFRVIPTGSGNDFARAQGITRKVQKEVDLILKGRIEKIDVLEMRNRHCITVIGLGFDGEVARVTNQMRYKKWLGRLAYLYSVLKVLSYYNPSAVKVTVGREERTFNHVWLVAVANHPYYGGGMKICPNANSQDGKLDVCVVHGLSKWKLLSLFPRVYKGSHVYCQGVTTYQTDSVHIQSEQPLLIHGDGENIGHSPVTISIKKEELYLISDNSLGAAAERRKAKGFSLPPSR